MENQKITKEEIRELVERFVDIIGYAVDVEINEIPDERFAAVLTGENLGALIGFHGKNIASIELILNLMAARKHGNRKFIILDINGYRENRNNAIEKYVSSVIKKIQQTLQPQDLYPMSASERLFVHTYVKDFPDLETQSSGEEPNRFITIKMKGQD